MPTVRLTAEEEAKLLAMPGVVVRHAKPLAEPECPVSDDDAEKKFQAEVAKLAKRNGWKFYHPYDSRKSEEGFPDCTITRNGIIIFAELKVLPNKPTAAQLNWLEAFALNPHVITAVWYPADWPLIVALLEAP